MEFPFRESVTKEVKSYANNTPLSTEKTIDLSLGVNPYGCSPKVIENIKNIDYSHISDYPHSKVLYEAISKYWSKQAEFGEDEIVVSNGSICSLYYLCNLFSGTVRKEIVGYLPTFTDLIEAAKKFGFTYTSSVNDGRNQDADDLIAKISENTAFVYVDRPQNPLGYTMPLSDVEKILTAARKKGAYVLMDEAYGDFITKEESSITLISSFDNLIVSRTFSKGLGLANLRAGYIIAPSNIVYMINHMLNPYILSDMERFICAIALSDEEYANKHCEDIARVKRQLRSGIGKNYIMLDTDDRVPICTLKAVNGGDLQKELMDYDLLTVSGVEFDSLDESYIRLRVPTPEYTEEFLKRIFKADNA